MAVNTTFVPSRLYGQHVANLRELELAIGHTARIARAQIACDDPSKSLRSMLRLYAFLVGAWAECRLQKLLHECAGVSDREREVITQARTQLEQWQNTVDLSFRKHLQIPNAPLVARTIGVTQAARRDALHSVLSNDLRIIIEIRNKLAHGQWVYPFNSEGTGVEQVKYRLINQENLLSLQCKYALVGHLADAVHDLVVSPQTFERDFDGHFRKLLQVRKNLNTRSYERYRGNLINRRQRARANSQLQI